MQLYLLSKTVYTIEMHVVYYGTTNVRITRKRTIANFCEQLQNVVVVLMKFLDYQSPKGTISDVYWAVSVLLLCSIRYKVPVSHTRY